MPFSLTWMPSVGSIPRLLKQGDFRARADLDLIGAEEPGSGGLAEVCVARTDVRMCGVDQPLLCRNPLHTWRGDKG